LKRPTLVSQGSLNRLLQSASEAWKRSDYASAIETMERASRLNPSNPAILLELGRMHGMRYDYSAAERCFEQAVRVSPGKTQALALAGTNSRDFRNPDLSERYYRRAVEQPDAPPEVLADLAEIYERLRRREEAAALVERALRQNPGCAAARLVRARLENQAGRPGEAEQLLRSTPAGASPFIRVRAAYELGQLLDRQGRYEEAMSAFLEAKSVLRPQAERPVAELRIVRARIQLVTRSLTPDLLQRWRETSLPPSRRLALLGGHPRSGTTLLEQVLDTHPDIVSAEETEIFHNDAYAPLLRGHPDDTAMLDGLAEATPGQLQQSRKNYFQAMDLSLGQPAGNRLLVDKNPSYTFLIPAFVRLFPEARLLIALRDPRDVALSCFMQCLPLNQSGAAFLNLESTVTEYSDLMNVWLALKPLLKNPWLEVRYEDMVEDLESVARRTLEFLGVPWDTKVLGFDEHARKKQVRSPTYADVTQPVYKRARGRWRNYQKYLEPHLEKLEPFVKAFGYE
jgi:Tfp pilus assembly protein PilF